MTNTVLVLGASGLIGTATIDAFLEEDLWEVVAVSRRRPEISSERSFKHVTVDLTDREASAATFRALPRVSHVVYAASFEKPGLVAGWSDAEQMQTNLSMLRNAIDPLSAHSTLEHVSIMQGTKAYGVHLHPIPIPARERQPRDNHPNFYWLQEDYLKEAAARVGFGWTIFRPVHVVGPAYGVAYSTPSVIGAFAAICRAESLPFGFPGGTVAAVKQVADVRLVARATRWAARARQAWGEHFNLTNGEVFSWLEIWPSLATTLGLPIAEPSALSMAEFLPSRAGTWERIVQQYGLRPLSMDQLLGQSHFYADYTFGYGLKDSAAPALVSTIKVKQAGFTDTYDTELTFRDALRALSDRKVLPRMC